MNDEIRQREFAERFGAALETWRFQVQSYWSRTTYFALFQIGAFSGLWGIFTAHRHRYTATFLSFLAAVLCVVWFINSGRMQQYIRYWWDRAAAIERDFNVSPARSLIQHHEVFRSESRAKTPVGSYSTWMRAVPCIFLCGWLWMFTWCLIDLWRFPNP